METSEGSSINTYSCSCQQWSTANFLLQYQPNVNQRSDENKDWNHQQARKGCLVWCITKFSALTFKEKPRELIFKGFIIACFIFPLESCVRRSRILCPKLVVHRLLLIRLKPTIQIRCHKRLAQVLRIVCCTCLTLPTQNFVMCILEGAWLVSVKSVTLL